VGNPLLVPQTPVTVRGFKDQINGTGWLVVRTTHSLEEGGFTTQFEMESA
jgi:phage protein D